MALCLPLADGEGAHSRGVRGPDGRDEGGRSWVGGFLGNERPGRGGGAHRQVHAEGERGGGRRLQE